MDQELTKQEPLKEKVKSRKFIFSIGIAAMSSILMGLGTIDAASYAQIINVTVLGYLTGNVAEKVMTKR